MTTPHPTPFNYRSERRGVQSALRLLAESFPFLGQHELDPIIAHDLDVPSQGEGPVDSRVNFPDRKRVRSVLHRLVAQNALLAASDTYQAAERARPLPVYQWQYGGLYLDVGAGMLGPTVRRQLTADDLSSAAEIFGRREPSAPEPQQITLYLAGPTFLATPAVWCEGGEVISRWRWADRDEHPALAILEEAGGAPTDPRVDLNTGFVSTRLGLARSLLAHYHDCGQLPPVRLTASRDPLHPHGIGADHGGAKRAYYYGGCRNADELLELHEHYLRELQPAGFVAYEVW